MALSVRKLLAPKQATVHVPTLLSKRSGIETLRANCKISKVSLDQQLVTGVVYEPFALDAHGHYMTAEDLRETAHDFLAKGLTGRIDVQHNNKVIDAAIVESWIARPNDPDGYPEGAWIATTKINDPDVWNMIKGGELNGYSFEIMTYKRDTTVEIASAAWYYGFTDPDPYDKHTHPFLVHMDAKGEIQWGQTGLGSDGSPSHTISKSSITDKVSGHTHRYHIG